MSDEEYVNTTTTTSVHETAGGTVHHTTTTTTTTTIAENADAAAEMTKIFRRKYAEYEDINIEDLLNRLTEEELHSLSQVIDPDDSFLPPHERCSYHTDKEATGPYSRRRLVEYLEEQAKQEKDWDTVPFVKKEPAFRWKPKPQPAPQLEVNEDMGITVTEFDTILDKASEEELVDLAAVLGFHSLLTSEQIEHALRDDGEHFGGFQSMTKATRYKPVADEPPNDTDLNDAIRQIESNDDKFLEVNLNNIRIGNDETRRLFLALHENSVLRKLSMSNTGLTDTGAQQLVDALQNNKKMALQSINVESNYITPLMLVELIQAVNNSSSVTELFAANQSAHVLGIRAEQKIAELVSENDRLLKLGLAIDTPGARGRIQAKLERNVDRLRLARIQ